MMIDRQRRKTLKAGAAAAATLAVPSLAGAGMTAARTAGQTATLSPPAGSAAPVLEGSGAFTLPGTGVSVTFSPRGEDGRQRVRLTNAEKGTVTLKHVYPGRVSTGDAVYDLNALFDKGPRTLAAGQSRVLTLSPVAANDRERAIPRGLVRSQAMRVATQPGAVQWARKGARNAAPLVGTTRSFLV